MDDATPPPHANDAGSVGKAAKPAKVKPRGPSRFVVLLLGLIVGVVGGLMLPSLFPAAEPTCTEPQRVVWEQTAGGAVSQTIETDAATADACKVEVVFEDQ